MTFHLPPHHLSMDQRQIGLKLAMDKLDLPVDISSFERRLTLQKSVYLAQAAGVNLGYPYRWYLRGPYSQTLTADAFALVDAVSARADESRDWELDEVSQRKLKLIGQLRVGSLPRDRALELLASVHFLVQRGWTLSRDPGRVKILLASYGKPFERPQVAEALRILEDNDLIATPPRGVHKGAAKSP